MENTKAEVREKIKEAQKVLIGIGKEWALRDDEKDIRFRHLSDPAQSDLKAAYEELYQLIQDKDYYIVTTLTDGAIYEMPFDKNRIVAPVEISTGDSAPKPAQRISGKKEKYRMISVHTARRLLPEIL